LSEEERMGELWRSLFSWMEFMPHGHCYLWKPGLVWLEVLSNAAIGGAYVFISCTLAYIVWRVRDIPFQWVYLAFGVFIISCGGTHFFDVVVVWTPLYWLDGGLRALTAGASVATAVALVPLVPKVVGMVRAAQAGRELEALKAQFFANVSHELRTPLALILGPTEKLLADGTLSREQRASLELVDRNARTLLKHVNDLLDVSKLEAGKTNIAWARADVAGLVRLVASHFDGLAADKRMTLTVDAPPTLPAALDVDKIQRVLLNLCANAFKFTPAGGKVRLSARAEGARAIIEVADSGPGIRLAERATVFERFRQLDGTATRRFGGTGLGLAIARDFVTLHGGTIAIGDAPEGGALFTVTLPVEAPKGTELTGPERLTADTDRAAAELYELQALTQVVARAVDSDERGRVLVVEDSPDMGRFIAETLASQYTVERAHDGIEGLEKALARPPDLILSDIMMPRMSGDQLVTELRSRRALDAVPIVFLTAKADDELRVRLLRAGAQDYLMKPFSVEELRARIANLVTMKRARDLLSRELDAQLQDLEALAGEVTTRKRELAVALAATRVACDKAEHASRIKTDFLSMVSHELRTPLTALRIQVERMARDPDLIASERHRKIVQHLAQSSERLERLIDSLLYYARADKASTATQVMPVDARGTILDVLDEQRQAADAKGVGLLADIADDMPAMHTDGRFLRMIVSNVVGNAVKFTERGEVRVHASWSQGRLTVRVVDTGPGIAAIDHERVFEPFEHLEPVETKHTPGFGLGLALVKQMLEALGGEVSLQSAPGQGSTFTIELPAPSATALAK
jgi:signal transduction histidine kinase